MTKALLVEPGNYVSPDVGLSDYTVVKPTDDDGNLITFDLEPREWLEEWELATKADLPTGTSYSRQKRGNGSLPLPRQILEWLPATPATVPAVPSAGLARPGQFTLAFAQFAIELTSILRAAQFAAAFAPFLAYLAVPVITTALQFAARRRLDI